MGLSVEQAVWMGDEWNWLTIMSNGGLNVYAMDSNVARERKSQHIPDPLSGVTTIGLDVIIRYCS
jgi:3-deoxy-D-manno-octulosonate 8-phosphate phosphatase KdsC-like HAD superfamily phosphatase